MTVWFITGASRGFGIEIAGDRLLAVALDVAVPDQVTAAVDAAVERFGRIDVLVNNAGRGLVGAVEEAGDAEVRSVFEVNVFGLLAVTEIADYAASGGAARQWADENNHGQEGDPVKAAAIVDLADRDDLPERIQFGRTAFEQVADKLARTARDQQAWREVSLSSDYATG